MADTERMFEFDGLPDLFSVPFSRLEPGMIVIDGLSINGYPPEEFRDFSPLSSVTIDSVHDKYRLRKDRMMRVISPGLSGLSSRECVDTLNSADEKLRVLNGFRGKVKSEYGNFGLAPRTALRSSLVRDDSLIFPWGARPGGASLFNRIDHALNLADILVRTVASQYAFPVDRRAGIHLVIDYSYSMQAAGRDTYVESALDLFYGYLTKLLPSAEFFLYAFSNDCRLISYPVSGKELPRLETSYESFLNKVLHHADRSAEDVVILFTDGLPNDHDEALSRLRTFPKMGIDYIQCIFNIEGDKRHVSEGDGAKTLDGYITDETLEGRRLSEREYAELLADIRKRHSEFTEAANGAQVILHVDKALSLVSVEAFDRWLGK